MFVPAYNTTTGPIVIDGEGRTLGGGEWGPVDRHDDHAQQAIGDGRLVIHPDLDVDAADVDQAAVDAADEANLLEERRTHLANVDVDQLRTLARSGDLDAGADAEHYAGLDKATLRRRLVRRTDIALTSEPAAEPDLAAHAAEATADESPPGRAAPPKAAPAKAAAARKGAAP